MPYEIDIRVPPGKKKERLDIFLTHHIENATRNKVQQAINAGLVLVNGRTVKPSHEVSAGEVIRVTLPKPPPQEALPENIPLSIVHEDKELLVVNKPAGMVTHPAYGNYSGTLVNALLHHCNRLSTLNEPTRPGIVHRLDKDTSGLMVVAKTDFAHAFLAKQFSERSIKREYWAIVWGIFTSPTGRIDADLARSKSDRKKIAVMEGGKRAVTEYAMLKQFEYLSLVSLKLLTGRTHQIRVHLAHIQHPVFGDPTYNGRRVMWGPGGMRQKTEVQHLLGMIARQALHAKTIGFIHPATRKTLQFDSALPDDMVSILNALEQPDSTL
jgi:23S rRNA pseudouridine1911/1915/1917 synthase